MFVDYVYIRVMNWLNIFGLAVPVRCAVCGEPLVSGERWLCAVCRATLPRERLDDGPDGMLRERLAVRHIDVAHVVCWTAYVRDSRLGELLRQGKYSGRPRVFAELGRAMGADMCRRCPGVRPDVLLPVPMHWRKRLLRGYNQAEVLARGLGRALDVPVGDNLRAVRPHATQTRRSAGERVRAQDGVFGVVHAAELRGLHVGVVDDILTTGGTMSAALEALREAGVRTVSVLTLAVTPRR